MDKKILKKNSLTIGEPVKPSCIRCSTLKYKTGDGSLFDNPRLPLAKQTFIGMMIMPGKQ